MLLRWNLKEAFSHFVMHTNASKCLFLFSLFYLTSNFLSIKLFQIGNDDNDIKKYCWVFTTCRHLFIHWLVIHFRFKQKPLWSYIKMTLFSLIMVWNLNIFRKGNLLTWKILSFPFAIQGINQDLNLLQNISLGYSLHDNHFNTIMTLDALLGMLSTGVANIPNYRCGSHNGPLVVLDGSNDDISMQISNMLGIYKIPQVCVCVGGHDF